jgi:hypothetical protein
MLYIVALVLLFVGCLSYRILLWLLIGRPITWFSVGLALALSLCVTLAWMLYRQSRLWWLHRRRPTDST